jgi:HAD superfamily hydrolase (TIGR01484 family)
VRKLGEFPLASRRRIAFVFVDVDDTLTTRGRLTGAAYAALEKLQQSGRRVVPVTGRSAGWCDMIARFWPVDGVIGENGAFYFRHDREQRRLTRRFWDADDQRRAARRRLDRLAREVLAAVPGAALAADQPYRLADLAIDVAEDVAPLAPAAVDQILGLVATAGAQARLSSAHVNIWFGEFDKLAMTRCLVAELYGIDLDDRRNEVVFIGDSPNDEAMFGYFPHAVAVANIRDHLDRIATPPAYVTKAEAGAGFVELVDALLA